jgi:OmpA-OmpF porin, OOP family
MQSESMVVPNVWRYRLALALVSTFALSLPAHAQQTAQLPPMMVYAEGQKAKIRGVIVDRNGDEIRVREGDKATHDIMLKDDTKIETPSGFLKMDRIRRDTTTLLPGLMLTVEGHGGEGGRLYADKIKFSSTSYRTAQQINVGTEKTKGQVAANADSIARNKQRIAAVNKRVSNLDDYDLKSETIVWFETGSAQLSQAARQALDAVITNSATLKGYLIEVTGYADTTGTPAVNRPLSAHRAEAVVAYLTEVGKVPLRRILNPTGMGTADAIATNKTPDGRAMNRRAQVRVLLNRSLGEGNHR